MHWLHIVNGKRRPSIINNPANLNEVTILWHFDWIIFFFIYFSLLAVDVADAPFCYNNFIVPHQLCAQFRILIRLLNGKRVCTFFLLFLLFLHHLHIDIQTVRIFNAPISYSIAYGFNIFIVIFNIFTVFHVCRHAYGINDERCNQVTVYWADVICSLIITTNIIL